MLTGLFIPTKSNRYQPLLLRKVALTFYTIVLVLVNSFGGLVGIPEVMASSVTAANLISLTNQQRTAAGLNALNTDSRLTAAAQAKANNMFQEQYWDHFGPNGESPWMFISQSGYKYVYAGENLAKGFKTAEGVHEAWMASPTHKENILSGNYKDIGIAVVEGTLLGKRTILVVQMFGNLTSQTAKTGSVKPAETTKATIVESGQIKSISISTPKTNELINDANVDIKGSTTNVSGKYIVEIIDNGNYVGETESESSAWTYDKKSDWEEGERKITAQLKDTNTKSQEVTFTIDSTPPVISKDTIAVQRSETEYTLSFKVPEGTESATFVTGEKTFDLEINDDGNAVLGILKGDVGDRSLILLSDSAGNISEQDVSEYFLEGDEETFNTSGIVLWIRNTIGTTDGISLAIILFVFILLLIQVYVQWRKRVIGKNAGSLLTIGAWWLIILVGAFKGFEGIIN
jgi:hypothetical protein